MHLNFNALFLKNYWFSLLRRRWYCSVSKKSKDRWLTKHLGKMTLFSINREGKIRARGGGEKFGKNRGQRNPKKSIFSTNHRLTLFFEKRKRTWASQSFPYFPQTFPFPLFLPLPFQHLPPKPAPSPAPSPLSNGLSTPSPEALISLSTANTPSILSSPSRLTLLHP